MSLVKIASDRRHLVDPQGNPFFIFGINYTGYFDRTWKMWEPDLFDPDLIVRDFRKVQKSGVNVIRLFVHVALAADIAENNFVKLDQTLSLAQDHHLLVLLALNDAHSLDLKQVSDLDVKIASRYKEVPTILGYDLESEPVFYNLVAANYPEAYHPPIQTGQLIDHYGERVSQAEAIDLQRSRRIPGHLKPEMAYYYINALRLFLEYDATIDIFVKQGKGTLVDFMLSEEAQPWHKFIEVLHGTVDAWLRARIEPIRATGSSHLLTVGWNWLHLAALPANHVLDFQEYHNYVDLSLEGFNTNVSDLAALRRAFPNHPVVFGEFGWSNQSSTNPVTSISVHPDLTGLYEAATFAYLRANRLAGGFKWKLNDIENVSNPYESSFGMFKVGDEAKSIHHLLYRFSQDWPSVKQQAVFTAHSDLETSFSYRFDLPQQTMVGGYIYQDHSIRWKAEGLSHCFIKKEDQELIIDAHGSGQLFIDPWELIPTWDRAREADLYRIFGDNQRTRQQSFNIGESVEVDIRPGGQYVVAMGKEAPTQPPPLPQVVPKPGEHVLLLADFENYFQAALQYIRRFTPDFAFKAHEVGERWAYVTVIAPPEQLSDEVLDDIRSAGAILVERVAGDTPAATKTILDDMASRGQRFLTMIAPFPHEEPPIDSGPPPSPDGVVEIYIVQPGDTLSKIAQQVYGEARLWPLIFETNRDKLTSPSLIRAGMELRIPKRE